MTDSFDKGDDDPKPDTISTTSEDRANNESEGTLPEPGQADTATSNSNAASGEAVSDENPSEKELRERVQKLSVAAEEARSQASEYLEDLQRLKAEFENFRKRMIREQTAAIGRASERLIEELLLVLDDFDLALSALNELDEKHQGIVKGMEAVYEKLYSILTREGIERIDAAGVPFDAEVHEAVAHDDNGSDDDLVVTEVFRPGYRLKTKVIRPAMVKVGPKAGG